MPRPNVSAFCVACGTFGRPMARTIPFCSSRCRILAARRGVFLAEDAERFDGKVERDGGCLIFQGDLNHAGYGTFYIGRYGIGAHVFAWIRRHGPVPEGYEIAHACHRRACVEEEHLSPKTHLQNMQHSVQDGRMASGERNAQRARPEIRAVGERSGAAKMTTEKVLEARSLYTPGRRGYGARALAHRYGISEQSMAAILTRKTWRHI